MVCENKVSEIKALENLNVDEYYSTLSTYVKIIDEKSRAMEKQSKEVTSKK